MRKRRPFQKILRVVAVISYLAMLGCGIAAAWLSQGTADPVVASLMASVVFFAGVGIVLQVIASSNLPDLKIRR